jgi:nucleotide-binding universal stress UspA family protein
MSATSWPSESKVHGIIVGADGSDKSRLAIDWAAREAAQRNVALTVVHVLPSEVQPWITIPVPEDYVGQRDRRAEQVVNDAMRVVAHSVSGIRDIAVEHRTISGPAVPALVDISKDADMIVVGRRGLGGVQGLLLGSVSSGLMHHSHCPVALIHNDAPLLNDAARAPMNFHDAADRH